MKTINADLLLEILQAERASCCVADQPGLDLAIEILKEQDDVVEITKGLLLAIKGDTL
jgi:sulfur transfer complex TusBCD TusB component (DsrH family)